jgi:class III poly(R)-hydroxyalkanoic acid synthase PhaE subunit
MVDTDTSREPDWIHDWIGRQREELGRAGAAGPESAERVRMSFEAFPPLGPAREQIQAWRELAAAQGECQRLERELRAVLTRVQLDALSRLEQRVRATSSTQPIGDFHELYDLWIQCGEAVFAEVAHEDAYCRLQAELGNATMRLRAREQALIEYGLKQFDLPTRSELNSVHRQIRELRERLAALEAQARPPREEHE